MTFITDKSGVVADAGGVVIVTNPLEPELEGAVIGPEGYGNRQSWACRGAVGTSGARRPAKWLGAVVVLGGLLAGCGSGAPSSASHHPSTTVRSTVTPNPSQQAEAAALAAYRAMWADMVIAARTSDYQSPILAEHASGNALALLIHGLAVNRQEGIVSRGQPTMDPQVLSMSPAAGPTQVDIVDCFDDAHWLNYKVSGGLQNNVPGGRHHTTATVVDTAGVWKVTELQVGAAGTC